MIVFISTNLLLINGGIYWVILLCISNESCDHTCSIANDIKTNSSENKTPTKNKHNTKTYQNKENPKSETNSKEQIRYLGGPALETACSKESHLGVSLEKAKKLPSFSSEPKTNFKQHTNGNSCNDIVVAYPVLQHLWGSHKQPG